jgi:3-phenylpropionate/trans-cinnamate dioxygenase ferredoxin reductase component
MNTLAIVGASLAGAKAAEAARDSGFDGRIVLIGDEPGAPYERPPLSKDILRGDKDTDTARVHPDGFYADRSIELVHERATALDAVARTVALAGGDTIAFDTAVLATGATPRRLDVPGAQLAGVHYLRTMDDAVRLHDAIRTATRVAVIGAGWIGSEVAASARQMGADVTLIGPAPTPLHRIVGDEIGEVFRRLHADNGVTLRPGTGVSELRGAETVEEIVLSDGRVEAADVVVVGVGVTPRTELAGTAGLHVDNGIIVDQHLETTVAGMYAAGDVANAWHPHYHRHVRVEHWANALNQGSTAGRNAAGVHEAYDRLPYFFSDQYNVGLEYVGHGDAHDTVVVRGDRNAREFIAFWLRDDVVTAAMNVNVWDVVDDLKAIVAGRRPVEPALLADSTVALGDLVTTRASGAAGTPWG